MTTDWKSQLAAVKVRMEAIPEKENTMQNETRKYMSAAVAVRVHEALKKAIIQTTTNTGAPAVEYRAGLSDEIVAAQFDVSVFAVANLRRELFGHLRIRGNPEGPWGKHSDRIAALERRLDRLEDLLTSPAPHAGNGHDKALL